MTPTAEAATLAPPLDSPGDQEPIPEHTPPPRAMLNQRARQRRARWPPPRLAWLLGDAKVLSIGAAAAGQVVMLAAMALVSRHYPAAALSQYGVFFALFGILQIANSLRVEQGLVYERTAADRRALFACGQVLVLPVSLLTGLAAAAYLGASPAMRPLVPFLMLVVIAANASSLARVNVQAVAALDRFGAIPAMNLLRPALIGVCQIAGIGLAARSGVALAAAFAASQVIYAAGTYAIVGPAELRRAARSTPAAMRAALIRNRQFPAYSLPQNLLYTVSEALVPLSLPFLFPGSASVALFWLAARTVFAPATIVAESIRPIVYREIARAGDAIRRRCVLTAALLGLPILAGVGVLALAGGHLFALVFGAQWAAANGYALVLGLLVAFNMASLPLVGALPVIGMQRAVLIAEGAGFVARAAVLGLHRWPRPEGAVLAASLAYMAVMGLFFARVLHRLGAARGRDTTARPLRIGLFGVPGYNRGDDAISLALRGWLREHLPDARLTVAMLTPPADAPMDIAPLPIDRRSPRGLWRLARGIAAQDIIVIGGGSLVQDKHGGGRVRGVLGLVWWVTAIARLTRRPVITACLGVDALTTAAGRRAAREALRRCAWLSVRDAMSAGNVRALLGPDTPVEILPDPAFAFAADQPAPAHGAFILAPAFEGHDEAHIVAVYVALARRLHAALPDATFTLVAMDHRAQEDGGKLGLIAGPLAAAGIAVETAICRDAHAAAALLRGARGVVAMRLHALILGYGHSPLFCLSRTTKTEALMLACAIAGCDVRAAPEAIAADALTAMADGTRWAHHAAHQAEILDACAAAALTLATAVQTHARG